MLVSDILAQVRLLIIEPSTNAQFTDAYLTNLINEWYKKVVMMRDFDWRMDETIKTFVYTGVANTSTGTTLYVDSYSNMYIGQKLLVCNSGYTMMEEVEVLTCASTTVTLVSPGLTGSYVDGDYVHGITIAKPTNCDKIFNVRLQKIENSVQTMTTAKPISRWEFYKRIVQNTYGAPQYYFPRTNEASSEDLYFYPAADFAYKALINFLVYPSTLTGADTPLIPSIYHMMLAYGAAALALMNDRSSPGSQTLAAMYKAEAESKLMELLSQADKNQYDRVPKTMIYLDSPLPDNDLEY